MMDGESPMGDQGSARRAPTARELQDRTWMGLTIVGPKGHFPVPARLRGVKIQFSVDGTVLINDGVNVANGTYFVASSGEIAISPGPMTTVGPPMNMSPEEAVTIAAVHEISHGPVVGGRSSSVTAELEGNDLTLTTANYAVVFMGFA